MKQFKRTKFAALMMGVGLTLMGQSGWAADGPTYKFSGFGTLAGTVTNDSDLQFRSSMNQSKGANSTLDLGVDSKLGLQGVVDFGSGMTVTGQVLAQRRRVDDTADSNRDFDLGVEWLMAQYSPTSNLDLRLGRVVLPAFMISDSRNVTYTQPWLRAPLEVYGQMPLTTLDGVQAVWRIPVGAAVFSIQPSFGKSAPNVSVSGLTIKPDYARVASLNASFEYGDWLARVGQVRGNNVNTALELAPGMLPTLVFDMKDTFTNFGVQFDNGSAIVMAEYATRRMNDLPTAPAGFGPAELAGWGMSGYAGQPLAKTDHWYVAGGWRFGKWLPMLAYGRTTDKSAAATPANTGVDLSLRYDLMTNVALKAQFSRYQSQDGVAFVAPTTAANDKKVNILSAGLDFVF